MIFEATVQVPDRPCPPTQPPDFRGPKLDWTVTKVMSSYTTAEKQSGMARLNSIREVASQTVYTDTLKTGFVQASLDTTTPYTATNVGHLFGRMGVGTITTPGAAGALSAF